MKQRLLKVFFICMAVAFLPQVAHAAGDIEINATNFPDDNFRNYLLEQEYGKDGKLTKAEIENVNKLDVVGKNISSLQGIEYFTALATLNCSNNQLTALDVSKHTILGSLDCSNNQLTALDVSKNTALNTLYFHCNQIKGTSMDNLINSLPTNNNADSFFELYVYSSVNPNEGNVCTKEQVLAAEEKGWRVWCEIDAYGGWTYYEGSDDTPSNVNDIRTETGQDAPVYDLRGQCLTAPQKGVNIIGGRKVVVK
ncbi:MAG: hypothetical protein K2J86_08235 [Prevotella sp.]|nr:hypothetical protein [Prevotella sp.]